MCSEITLEDVKRAMAELGAREGEGDDLAVDFMKGGDIVETFLFSRQMLPRVIASLKKEEDNG